MVRVLIADNDLDSHELVDDLVEMTFRDVKIDRALSNDSLFSRLDAGKNEYDLILFNYTLQKEELTTILKHIETSNPSFLERIVFITSDAAQEGIPERFPVLVRPFSLDEFNEVVKKTCVC